MCRAQRGSRHGPPWLGRAGKILGFEALNMPIFKEKVCPKQHHSTTIGHITTGTLTNPDSSQDLSTHGALASAV